MAKQESIIKFRGRMGDLSFYKDRNGGYMARAKGGVDGQRIASDPNFQRTRENMAEFGRANQTAKRLRHQLNNLLFYFADKTLANRLTSLVHRIQKADAVSPRGERAFLPENASMLRGFEFNRGMQIRSVFAQELAVAFDRGADEGSLVIPPFNPQNSVTLLQGATHLQFVFAAAALDLDAEFPAPPEVVQSPYIPLVGQFPGETLTVSLTADAALPVYLIVGVGVYQEVNGQYYPLNNGQYNAMTIAEVDQ